jgi:hypothetical protein
MECKLCKENLMVSENKFESDINTTEVYSVMKLVCTNPKCDGYCGTDLNKPIKVAETVRNKVN